MNERDSIRLQHILDAAREALAFVQHRHKDDLAVDRMLALSLVKEIEIIGEAANQISKELRESHPSIPWGRMIGMRNRLIHGYSEIDFEVLWDTVESSLPALISQLVLLLDDSH